MCMALAAAPDHFVLMEAFAQRIRKRAADLGMSNAEVARRLNMGERTYGHYVAGDRQPNLETLIRIANVLLTSPNALLGFGEDSVQSLPPRFVAAAQHLPAEQIELFTIQIEAVAQHLRTS